MAGTLSFCAHAWNDCLGTELSNPNHHTCSLKVTFILVIGCLQPLGLLLPGPSALQRFPSCAQHVHFTVRTLKVEGRPVPLCILPE